MGATRAAMAAVLQANYPEPVLAPFLKAAANYLAFIVRRFNRQDAEHCSMLGALVPLDHSADRAVLADLTETLRLSEAAVEKLSTGIDASAAELSRSCREYNRFYSEVLIKRRHAIYHLFEQHYRVDHWRRASFVDADSILEERRLYAAVTTTAPKGIELRTPDRRP